MIFNQLSKQLQTLQKLLALLNNQQYSCKIGHLGDANIGGHTRHIIELLQCAIEGYHTGSVDYINRKRNLSLEQDKQLALEALQAIIPDMRLSDKILNIVVQENEATTFPAITTTYFREIVYNTEHTIHHLALIKVALIEMQLQLVDEDFGMAYSTITYKNMLKTN